MDSGRHPVGEKFLNDAINVRRRELRAEKRAADGTTSDLRLQKRCRVSRSEEKSSDHQRIRKDEINARRRQRYAEKRPLHANTSNVRGQKRFINSSAQGAANCVDIDETSHRQMQIPQRNTAACSLPCFDPQTSVASNAHQQQNQSLPYTIIQEVPNEPFLLPEGSSCEHCNAKKFWKETSNFCCRNGQVKLCLNEMPNELRELFLTNSEIAKNFRKICRSYNNHFVFTSFGVNYDKDLCRMNKGIYTFRVQGHVHHFVNALLPKQNNPSYLQLYFYDTEHEVECRTTLSPKFDIDVLKRLIEILETNPYSQFFRSLGDVQCLESINITLRANPTVDQRVFNKPCASQVAALWVENDAPGNATARDICVRSHLNETHRVKYYYGCYYPLQYPLLFPYGEPGWHEGIKKIQKNTRTTIHGTSTSLLNSNMTADELLSREETVLQTNHCRTQVSSMEYYCYKLQIRNSGTSAILHTGRLFQQYVVDMYVKIETARLDFYRLNQTHIRSELYQGVVDCVHDGETVGRNVGKRIVLPASFLGSPRDNSRRYMDAMALVQRFGKPDLFLTMTCNPNWPEIKAELRYNDEPQNRPDLVARVFKAKLEELKNDIINKAIFGAVAAYIYVVEFQKRGLPHVHFLIILKQNSKILSSDVIDKIVSCQIPSLNEQPYLRSRVVKHMMHGPCGVLNPTNVCMQPPGNCKNKYPREFIRSTTIGQNSYATYKRPNNQEAVKIRGHHLDNRWVVPYNPYLLAKFDCHINVEICSTVKAVKYMYKYLYKGHDRISFMLGVTEQEEIIDEISRFQNARWISPPEAIWRIYGFHLFGNGPSVIRLQLHLENKQPVTFKDQDNLTHITNNDFLQRTMLTEFFRMNAYDPKAKTILYRDFPKYYVWDPRVRQWHTRKQNFDVIGRIVFASPNEGDRYYLRLLLSHIKGPTWYDDYYEVDGIVVNSFRAAAAAYGLLNEDKNCDQCMAEAIIYGMPSSLRRLFATILLFCAPNDPVNLWITYKDFFMEDYMAQGMTNIVAEQSTLKAINNILELSGRDINDYKLVSYNVFVNEQQRLASMITEETTCSNVDPNIISLHTNLNIEQQNAYNIILERVTTNQNGVFFIDGPGGTGKTFLYKTLLTAVRKRGFIALATASSGVAASLLLGGRTGHSRFKIPLELLEDINYSVTKQSALGKLIIMSKLIIWDEAPMVHRFAIEALHKLLQDLMSNKLPFGGKVIVFGGDFRQILPVIQHGTEQDIIQSSLICSPLWPSFTRIFLTQNMRAHDDDQFSKYLLLIGNGEIPTHCSDMIQLMADMIIPFEDERTTLERLISYVFPDDMSYESNSFAMVTRVILTPKNENVDFINNILLEKMEGDCKTYYSYDEPIDSTDHDIHEDFLNTLTPNGMPAHELILKKNCPVLLLRNINPSEGLCNGTRLLCQQFNKNVIEAVIATGEYSGKNVLLPRIPFIPLESEKGSVPFKRTQFPIRACFAMTINKAQGQTLDYIGLYLPEPVFSHGQLYVALSRARTSGNIKIVIKPLNEKHKKKHPSCTRNVVYQRVLHALQEPLEEIV